MVAVVALMALRKIGMVARLVLADLLALVAVGLVALRLATAAVAAAVLVSVLLEAMEVVAVGTSVKIRVTTTAIPSACGTRPIPAACEVSPPFRRLSCKGLQPERKSRERRCKGFVQYGSLLPLSPFLPRELLTPMLSIFFVHFTA